jgi:tetraacyldisaccharide 4'-kinase
VISIGNLSVGGTGKTPVVAAVARWLIDHGERPAILSRGYKRREPVPGVVVVSDGRLVTASLARAGDEPLMLAHAVPGAVVCVAEDRYLAGLLAERTLGATVHVLDDGFQHFGLARDLDVLVTSLGEIPGGHVLPRGRLREPVDAAARAHVLVVMGATPGAASAEAWTLGVGEACGARRVIGEAVRVGHQESASGSRTADGRNMGDRVLLVAAIANPQRFADDVRGAGEHVVGEQWFADHHAFTAGDLARIASRVRETGAEAVFTTDKDAVRFEALGPIPFPLYRVPLTVEFDPPAVLFDRIVTVIGQAAGGSRQSAGGNRQSDAGNREDPSGSPLPFAGARGPS